MSEYDYSPAAVAQYQRTNQRIANWAQDTAAVSSEYSNPFLQRPEVIDELKANEFYQKPSSKRRPLVSPQDSISCVGIAPRTRDRPRARSAPSRGQRIRQREAPPPLPLPQIPPIYAQPQPHPQAPRVPPGYIQHNPAYAHLQPVYAYAPGQPAGPYVFDARQAQAMHPHPQPPPQLAPGPPPPPQRPRLQFAQSQPNLGLGMQDSRASASTRSSSARTVTGSGSPTKLDTFLGRMNIFRRSRTRERTVSAVSTETWFA
ncbi:hypothetical protein MKEN_01114100 [Mycena kentingensis (nom. inval.)]|nr:hypothetical protein MKEN_01114100 [Mycena kentingensis (nom. inval.)]